MRLLPAAILGLALTGCIAQTAVDIVKLPVKAATETVDILTTSQAEADRKLGRQVRERDECIGKEERRARKEGREPDHSRC